MTVYYVADGPRVEASLPPIVARILGTVTPRAFSSWQSIRLHRGYGRKLKYAIRRAKSRGYATVVAVVDRDAAKKRQRLGELDRRMRLCLGSGGIGE